MFLFNGKKNGAGWKAIIKNKNILIYKFCGYPRLVNTIIIYDK